MSDLQIDWDEYKFELPVDGSQDNEFLRMGFVFGRFEEGDKYRGADNSEGWKVVDHPPGRAFLVDNKDRTRAIIYTKRYIHMRPILRFRYGKDPYIENADENLLFCIWDANVRYDEKQKVVFEKAHTVPNKQQHKAVHESREKFYYSEFEVEARKWLNEKYPHWESYGHWDE